AQGLKSASPKVLEPVVRQFGVSDRVLDVLVPGATRRRQAAITGKSCPMLPPRPPKPPPPRPPRPPPPPPPHSRHPEPGRRQHFKCFKPPVPPCGAIACVAHDVSQVGSKTRWRQS